MGLFISHIDTWGIYSIYMENSKPTELLTSIILFPIIIKMFNIESISSFEGYFKDIDSLPDVDIEKLDKFAIEAKSHSNFLTSRLMLGLLKTLKFYTPKICKGYYEYIGDLINTWLFNYLPKYVKNFDPEKGHFRYYIQKHLKKDLYNIFLTIIDKRKVDIDKYPVSAGDKNSISRSVEIKENLEKIKKLWKKIEWNSDIYKAFYCAMYSFFPEFKPDENLLNEFKNCYKSPTEYFDHFLIAELTEDHSKITSDYSKICNLLNLFLNQGYPSKNIEKWNKSRTADRVRNFKLWLRKKLSFK